MKDTYNTNSPHSDSVILYAGTAHETFEDDFNEPVLRKYLNQSGWGISTDYAMSGYSLTDSPDGNYPSRSNNMLTIFPCEGGYHANRIIFWHAVFVEKGDSAIVEYSTGNMNNWKMLASFDKTMYEPWSDGVKDKNDWKYEMFDVIADTMPIYFRFRLKTNTIKQNDGWYIDDMRFEFVTSVEDYNAENNIILYPNPAGSFLNIDELSQWQRFDSFGYQVIIPRCL